MLNIFFYVAPRQKSSINTVPCMHFCVSSVSASEILSFEECSTFSSTSDVYQTFNLGQIDNLIMVLAQFCAVN